MRIRPLIVIFLLFISQASFFSQAKAENLDLISKTDKNAPIIRNIFFEIRDVFDQQDQEWFYKTANSLKINTRKELLKRELLFKEGEPLNLFVIQESERNLRSLSYIDRVSITHNVEGAYADITVRVHDTWTLIPTINYSSGSGNERRSVGISEGNIAGYGKRVELLYDDNDGRTSVQGVYDDARFLGTHKRLILGAFDRSDGYRGVFSYGRPFRSVIEKRSWLTSADISDSVGKLYEAGDESFIYRKKAIDLGAGYSWAYGDPESKAERFTVGYLYQEDNFSDADLDDFNDVDIDPNEVSRDPELLAEDRTFSTPFISYQSVVPDYISLNYIDRFERVEDFNLGRELQASLGFATTNLGSTRDALMVSLNGNQGKRFSKKSILRAEIGSSSRVDADGLQNSLLRADLRYYNVLGELWGGSLFLGNHTLASSLSLDLGHDFDKDRQLTLGADNGLRGYDSRTLTGDSKILLNIEERFHLVDDFFQLISIGGAVFADIGGVSNRNFSDLIEDQIYSDVGVGLRIAFPRSSGARVLRVDLAFPLRDGPDGSDTFELRILLSGGQAFSDRLRGETLLSNRSDVAIGVDD